MTRERFNVLMTIKTRSAVIRQVPGKFEIVELDLDEPGPGEVLVRMVATGLCHSDYHLASGSLRAETLPMCAGHEGAGVVERLGPDTHGVEVGDHVVLAFIPVCGRCRFCSAGRQNLCDLGTHATRGSRAVDANSFRMHLDGRPVGQSLGLGAFSEYTTVDIRSVVRIPRDVPLDLACLASCSVLTGWGAAVNAAKVRPGDVAICVGVGGIGVNAVQGAAHAGASAVIAVDPVELKRTTALELGATAAFADMEEAARYARSLTNGQGADQAIVAIGELSGEVVAEGFAAIRKAGTLVVVTLGDVADRGLPIPPLELVAYQKRIQGTLFGSSRPLSDIPMALDMYRTGKLRLKELVTKHYRLDDIGQGYEDMLGGQIVRGVISF